MLGMDVSRAPTVGLEPGAHLFAVLILQKVSEGAVGLLKCAQLLQEKFLLPRQGVDVRTGHLFFLEDSKKPYMVQGEKRGAGRGRPHQDLRGTGARKPSKDLGCVQSQDGKDRIPGGLGPGRMGRA